MAGKVVAVVNHDPVFMRLVNLILKEGGFETMQCPSGSSAHDVIAEGQPDVVVVDTWLGTRDEGWVLVQTLRLDDLTRHIPILVCSADPREVEKRTSQLEQTPGVRVLAKPFDPDQLLRVLAEMTEPEPQAP